MPRLELGLDTFGDVTADADGRLLPHAQVIRDVVEEAVLADAVGVDVFGLGEHHRADFAVSAPEPVLAAIASRTTRIRLGSAVTVLSSDDPIRVFQRFSTLDALSSGRAEVILGRGSFTESFPLFGHALSDYETLFGEKLELFAALLRGPRVSWTGTIRPPLVDQAVFPPIEAGRLRTWIGVGGSQESVVRAARHGLPMMLAIIGGDPARFAPHVELYRRASRHFATTPQPVGVHAPGFVANTDEQAREQFWPDYKRMHDLIGAGRGWPPLQRRVFDAEIERGALHVGAPATVARKIAVTARALGLPLSHARLMRCIELYGTRVIPAVREMLEQDREPGGTDRHGRVAHRHDRPQVSR